MYWEDYLAVLANGEVSLSFFAFVSHFLDVLEVATHVSGEDCFDNEFTISLRSGNRFKIRVLSKDI